MGQRKLGAHARTLAEIVGYATSCRMLKFSSHTCTPSVSSLLPEGRQSASTSLLCRVCFVLICFSFQFDSSLGTCNFFGDPKKGQVSRWRAVAVFVVLLFKVLSWSYCSCGCSIGSFYAFLLLQRARIFGLASQPHLCCAANAGLCLCFRARAPLRGEK